MVKSSSKEVHTIFEKTFSYPAVSQRHREGPLASERVEYLIDLDDRGAASGTLLTQAPYCLCVAHEIHRWPREHCFNVADLESIAASLAAGRVAQGRAAAPRWPVRPARAPWACARLDATRALAHRVGPSSISSVAPLPPAIPSATVPAPTRDEPAPGRSLPQDRGEIVLRDMLGSF